MPWPVVVDDAHAALALAEQRTSLVIPNHHPTYTALLELFNEPLKQQAENALADVREGDRSAVLRIPFWAWAEQQTQVLAELRPYRKDDTFKWAWPLIHDVLPICEAVISADGIEIQSPCPPIEKFPSFAEAERRVYLTATLADDSILITHFDADPASVADSIVPDSAADLGDRLVLAPQELNPAVSDDEIRNLAYMLAAKHNVVVLAPSWNRANQTGRQCGPAGREPGTAGRR